MKAMIKRAILAIVAVSLCTVVFAQSKQLERARANGWTFELRAGANVGGPVPVPMPVEMRSIENYKPKMNGLIEAVVTKWLEPNGPWGIMSGLRFEQKGMDATARVKNYSTKIENSGSVIEGVWTGTVFTSFTSTYLAMPIQVAYKINNSGKVNGGLYMAYRMDGDFSGHVTDGHFRVGSPLGEKLTFGADDKASFDFKNELRRFETGMQVGGSWKAYGHFLVFADLKYSFNNIFKSKSYMAYNNMHPLYVSLGFSYLF